MQLREPSMGGGDGAMVPVSSSLMCIELGSGLFHGCGLVGGQVVHQGIPNAFEVRRNFIDTLRVCRC